MFISDKLCCEYRSEVPDSVEDLLLHTGNEDGDEHDPRRPAGPAGKSNGHGHAAGPAQYASGRRPGTSRGGSHRKLAALSTRERQNTTISDLQGLDNPGRGQDGVLGDHGEQAEDRLPQI